MADRTLDTTGLNCPVPVLKLKKALEDVPSGGVLEVVATDPSSVNDFEAFCRGTGHTLLSKSEAGGVYRFLIRNSA